MFASLSRGRSRIGTPYICSSCLSSLLTPSDPQSARLAANCVLQSAPFSTTGRNGQSEGKDSEGLSKAFTEAGAFEGTTNLLKTLKSSSNEVLKQLDALTGSDSAAKEETKEGGSGATDVKAKKGEKKQETNRSAEGKPAADEPSSPLLQEKKPTTPPADLELMAAISKIIPISKKPGKKKPPIPGREKGKAVQSTTPAPSKKGAKTVAGKKVKPPAKETEKASGAGSPASVAEIEEQVNKLGEGEARNALISAIQGKGKKQPTDENEEEVLIKLQKSVTSKLLPSNQRDFKKGTQTLKDAMQKPSLRRTRRPRSKTVVRLIRTNKGKDPHVSEPRALKSNAMAAAASEIKTISAADLKLVPINEGELSVPSLSYGLERVLFNPGVYHLQDPRSRVFNFDPYLQTIMPVSEFDFTLLKKFITSSRDKALLSTAKTENKKYTGSTSSMTSTLSHFHYLLSQWRKINPGILSKNFPIDFESFTALQRAPTAMFLRYIDGTYAIDADKEYDNANVLSMLGQSMEKLLTLSTEEFEQYRKHSSDPPSEEARNKSECYHYTTMGDFLMRSQLDAHDPRIPGTGMFDLKTRAVVSIRMDTSEYEHGSGYEIRGRHGEWESFEREYYDMIRAAFLKYSLQVRMGRMDGIFVAFHNTDRIFGFQYISLPEMDYALHGTDDTTTGDSEFRLSLSLLNQVLDRATAKFPKQSLRLFFETRERGTADKPPYMYIFAEPVDEKTIDEIQSSNKDKIEEFERTVLGIPAETEEEQQSQWESLQAKVEARIDEDEDDRGNVEIGRAIEGKEDIEEEEDDDVSREIEEEIDRGHHGVMEEIIPDTKHVLSEEVIDEDAMDSEQENEVGQGFSEVQGQEAQLLDSEENAEEDSFAGENAMVQDEESEAEEESSEIEEREEEVLESEENTQENIINDSIVGDQESEAEKESSEIEEQAEEMLETKEDGKQQDVDEEASTQSEEPAETDSTETPEQNLNEEPGEEDSNNPKEATSEASSETSLAQDDQKAMYTSEQKPILAMYLTIRNKVNGRFVKRPLQLRKDDVWKVEYTLNDISSQERAHALHEASKMRRAKALNKTKNETGRNSWNSQYIANIRNLSNKGRNYRKQVNEMEKEKPAKVLEGVVYGKGNPEAQTEAEKKEGGK